MFMKPMIETIIKNGVMNGEEYILWPIKGKNVITLKIIKMSVNLLFVFLINTIKPGTKKKKIIPILPV